MKLAPVLQVLDLTLTDLYVFQTAKKYFSKTKKGVYFGYQTFVLSCDPTLVIPQLKFEVSFLRLQKHDLVHPDKMGTRAKWLVDCLGIKEKSHVLDGNIEERREAFRVKLYSEHGNEDPVLLVDFYQY